MQGIHPGWPNTIWESQPRGNLVETREGTLLGNRGQLSIPILPKLPQDKMKFSLKKNRVCLTLSEKIQRGEVLFYMLPKPLRFSFVAFSIYDVHKDSLPSWFAEPLNIFQQIKHSCRITNNKILKNSSCYRFPSCQWGLKGYERPFKHI